MKQSGSRQQAEHIGDRTLATKAEKRQTNREEKREKDETAEEKLLNTTNNVQSHNVKAFKIDGRKVYNNAVSIKRGREGHPVYKDEVKDI